jgi:hypothetical protein
LDGLHEAVAKRLPGEVSVLNVDTQSKWPDVAPDAVLLLDSLGWFTRNRLSIPGRPWICAASFCFEDLKHLIELNSSMSDTGVQVLFSNCAEFVRHVSAAMSAKFCWKPLPPAGHLKRVESPSITGTVLSSVLDRDFSQLSYTFKLFEAANRLDRFCIYMPIDESMRLPDHLMASVHRYRVIQDAFAGLDYFVPAPRITDTRVGIIQPELVWAAACGCTPLLIHHPLTESLEANGFLMERSLRSYDVTVNMIVEHGDVPNRRVEMPDSMRFTVDQFVDNVVVAYERCNANAAGRL